MALKQRSRRMREQSSVVVDRLSRKDVSRKHVSQDQMQLLIRLQEELHQEREEKTHLQVEREKFQAFWEISRRTAEEAQAELRSRNREREEAEERHRVEISVYKQKLKVLLEQPNTVSRRPDDGTAPSTAPGRGQHAESGALREKKSQELKELNLKHQVELMELINEQERRTRELEVKHHEKMRSLMDTEERKRRMAVKEVEQRMRSRVLEVKEEQERALRRAEECFSAVQSRLLTDQEQLKKQLQEAQQENKHLTESLRDAQFKLPQLQTQLQQHNRNQAARCRARLKLVETELRDLKVEHELLLQAFNKVQRERDELLRSQQTQMIELQQRRSLKELQLQSRISSLTQTLQRTQQELSVCVNNAHTQQATHTQEEQHPPHQPPDTQQQEAAETLLRNNVMGS